MADWSLVETATLSRRKCLAQTEAPERLALAGCLVAGLKLSTLH